MMTEKEKRQREEIERLRKQNKQLGARALAQGEGAGRDGGACGAQKKTGSVLRGGGRGVLTGEAERRAILESIDDARQDGARASAAAAAAGYSRRTIERWRRQGVIDRRKGAVRRVPRKLSDHEEQAVVDYACAEEYQELTPYLIVAQLLTIGIYVASVSSFYRVLRRRRLLTHRAETAPRTRRATPPQRVATGPNQVWTWDITWMKSTVRGMFLLRLRRSRPLGSLCSRVAGRDRGKRRDLQAAVSRAEGPPWFPGTVPALGQRQPDEGRHDSRAVLRTGDHPIVLTSTSERRQPVHRKLQQHDEASHRLSERLRTDRRCTNLDGRLRPLLQHRAPTLSDRLCDSAPAATRRKITRSSLHAMKPSRMRSSSAPNAGSADRSTSSTNRRSSSTRLSGMGPRKCQRTCDNYVDTKRYLFEHLLLFQAKLQKLVLQQREHVMPRP